jgi:hypothetical protein
MDLLSPAGKEAPEEESNDDSIRVICRVRKVDDGLGRRCVSVADEVSSGGMGRRG